MIEPIMIFGIGFLAASLCGLVVIPLFHNRAVCGTAALGGAQPRAVVPHKIMCTHNLNMPYAVSFSHSPRWSRRNSTTSPFVSVSSSV